MLDRDQIYFGRHRPLRPGALNTPHTPHQSKADIPEWSRCVMVGYLRRELLRHYRRSTHEKIGPPFSGPKFMHRAQQVTRAGRGSCRAVDASGSALGPYGGDHNEGGHNADGPPPSSIEVNKPRGPFRPTPSS